MTHVKSENAIRIMVYSHDAFGLGNLRRMLAICNHLLGRWSNLSILLVSGSPMIHAFRLPEGLDYIKLPCLNRGISGRLAAKYLGTSTEATVKLRSQIIHAAAVHFKPNLLLVDKKPTGLQRELTSTLTYLQNHLPHSKRILLLRDILDTPQKTIDEWERWRYYQTIQTHYDRILVVGMQTVFDVVKEYRLPNTIAHRVRYCGYIRKWEAPCESEENDIDHHPRDRLVLVTPGGGEDGYGLVSTYLFGLKELQHISTSVAGVKFRSLILCGPEMPLPQQTQLRQQAAECPGVTFQCFSNHLFNHLKAASTVVAMSGYNTITEILSLHKSAVVVPRIQPSQEQLIRATRFTERGWVTMIHPNQVTGRLLMQAVLTKLANPAFIPGGINFDGLSNIARYLSELVSPTKQPDRSFLISSSL